MSTFGALLAILFLSTSSSLLASAQLREDYYANVCPTVETIVRNVVKQKIKQTFVTIPATLRLFFHDCFVEVNFANYGVTVIRNGSNVLLGRAESVIIVVFGIDLYTFETKWVKRMHGIVILEGPAHVPSDFEKLQFSPHNF